MSNDRPNPDELLARVKAEEMRARRGKLKIFFGAAPGVGKTYAMLEAARREKADGVDVVVGYVEPHGRKETEALLEGLETVPPRIFTYHGMTLREVDLDAVKVRAPGLVLVDELAHTNAEGSRHAKRWQDVEELRDAGIDVYSSLNVQHIESLNDIVAQITGVTVRETIPDQVFESADDLELADVTVEELLERLAAGKIYISSQAERAVQFFFQKANLVALRELALRRAAQRLHTEVEQARKERAATTPWATAERLLVCIGPSPTTARVIRTAKRMAAALDATWLAVFVDQAGRPLSPSAKAQIAQHFSLAERLGAETVTLSGQDVSDTILEYARSRNVTKIVLGKTNVPHWRRLLSRSMVETLLERSGEIDVYVIHGERAPRAASVPAARGAPFPWRHYLESLGIIAGAACLAAGLMAIRLADAEANRVMLLLAAVVIVAFRYGRGPAIAASLFAVLLFDFFFVPPYLTFAVSDTQYIMTFGVMLAIALIVSTLTAQLRAQVESSRLRERRTAALYQLGKQLSSLYGAVFLVSATGQKVAEMTGGEVAIYLKRSPGLPQVAFGHDSAIASHAVSVPAAQWVIEHDQIAGAGTNTLPNAAGLFLPLTGAQQTVGALVVRSAEIERLLEPEQRRLLEACCSQLALALERDQLAIDAAEARIQAEAEQVRNTLLSSVSHDLKTPLAAIAGASSSLLESDSLDEGTRRQLLETVADEAVRLNRLLENILQMSKLEAGVVTPNKQWHVLEELVGSALKRTEGELTEHVVQVDLPRDLPLIYVDGLLIEQVLMNLLENAARHTPPKTTVGVRASCDERSISIVVYDNGPGFPAGSEERIFDKFFRASPKADAGRGSGLGLAICRAIAKVHGGSITAKNRSTGGAEFVFRLPIPKDPPHVPIE